MKVNLSFILHKSLLIVLFAVCLFLFSPVHSATPYFLIPTVKIDASTTSLCRGATISFTAVTTNAGNNPTYAWKKNGAIIPGATLNIFSTADLTTGDAIQCVLKADPNFTGLETYDAASNIVVVNVFTEAQPKINITASVNNICPGTPVQFSSSVINGGNNPSFNWKINDKSVGSQPSFVTSAINNNDKVVCYITSDNPCNPFPVESNTIVMNARLIPTLMVRPRDTVVLAGTQVQLNTLITSNYDSFTWSPADELINPQSISPQTIPLLHPSEFHLTVKINNDCVVKEDVKIKVFRKLYMPNTFSPNNDRLNDVFRIPPDVALFLYEFSVYDRSGAKIFSTNNPEKGWDGTYNGVPKPTGIYIYVLRGIVDNKPVEIKETFFLVR